MTQLQILDKAKGHPLTPPFEHLSGCSENLYRVRSKSNKKNVRVIYFYSTGDNIILLYAFEEKSSHDYNNSINVATNRIKSLEREGIL